MSTTNNTNSLRRNSRGLAGGIGGKSRIFPGVSRVYCIHLIDFREFVLSGLRRWGSGEVGFSLGFELRRFRRVACLPIISGKREIQRAIVLTGTQGGLEQRNRFANPPRLRETFRDSQNRFAVRLVRDARIFVEAQN